jgi:hypothetical protein
LLDDLTFRALASKQSLCDPSWHRLAIEDTSQTPFAVDLLVDFQSESPSSQTWLSLQLGSMQSVDLLVDRFGRPPDEVQRDWQLQHENLPSTTSLSPCLLSHLLVLPDGRLYSLALVEALIAHSIASGTEVLTLDDSPPIPDEKCLRDAPLSRGTANLPLDDLGRGDLATTDLSQKPFEPKASSAILDLASHPSLGDQARLLSKTTLRDRRQHDRLSSLARSKKAYYFYAATGLVLLVGLGTWMSRSSPQLAQRDTSPSTGIAMKPEGEPSWEPEVAAPESLVPLEFSSDSQSLPENILDSQASSSIESLIGQIAGGKSPASIDSISFESVTEALSKSNDEAIVQESLAVAASEHSGDLSKATQPFAEPLDQATTPEIMGEAAVSANSATDKLSGSTSDPGFVAQSVSIRQAQFKSTIRVPFKPNDRQAVCRVKLNMADDVLLKPAEAIVLVGRQDTGWTVALDDDSVNLNIYLRSVPARSWYIATAVRLKLGIDTEIPIGKNDATQVCLRLQNYLRWLDQSRQVGESMRSNKKTRSMAMAGLEQIEKQTKSTEKSLKHWLAIEKLVLAFYEENAIEVELAASEAMLP